MAALTIQDVPAAGLGDVVFASATAGGDTVAYGSASRRPAGSSTACCCIVKNADTGSRHSDIVGRLAGSR
jgi:hypothetical protein